MQPAGPRIARSTWPRPLPPEAPERRGLARWRIAATMALRQSLRSWPSTVLVVLLVLLPMAAVSAAAVYAASLEPSPAQRAEAELGGADAWLEPMGGMAGVRQYLDDPHGLFLVEESSDEPAAVEPPDSVDQLIDAERVIAIRHALASVTTAHGTGSFTVVAGDAWDPLLDGRYALLEGRAPDAPSEVLATPASLERLGVGIGDEIEVVDPVGRATVVGTMTSRLDPDRASMLFAPADSPLLDGEIPHVSTWYAEGWHPTAAEVYDLNAQGVIVFDRALSQHPGDGGAPALESASGTSWALYSAAAAALVFCTYLVLLLAGSAFSVSAKRQQRSLAVAASLGASRGDVFRIVLFQGALMGLAGGIAGSAAGIGLAAIARAAFDSGQLEYTWGLKVPWLAIIGLVVFSALVGTLAAALPARSATRGDTLEALRGSRRPVAVSARRPRIGAAMIVTGLVLVTGSVIALVSTYNSPLHGTEASEPIYSAAMIAMIAGPLVLQIGVVLAGHWMLSLAATMLARLGVGARLAGRDGVANPGRSVPAFGAIAACAFLATASFGGVAVLTDMRAEAEQSAAPAGAVYASVGVDAEALPGDKTDLAAHAQEAASRADEMLIAAGAASTAVVREAVGADVDPETGEIIDDPEQTLISPEVQVPAWCEQDDASCEPAFHDITGNGAQPIVVAPADLDTALGAPVSDDDRRAFASGAAIITDRQWLTDDGALRLNEWRPADLFDERIDETGTDPLSTTVLDARLITGAQSLDAWRQVYLAPETAAGLGIETIPSRVIAAFDEVTTALLDGLAADAETITAASRAEEVPLFVTAERADPPPDAAPWLWLVLGAVSVLVIAASAVSLGLSRHERGPDDATLAAVGAPGRVRRSVNAFQALVVAGFGCLTGTVAGLMPVLGVVVILRMTTGDGPTLLEVPWSFYGLLAVALPIAIALVSGAVPPARADLTHRTAIA